MFYWLKLGESKNIMRYIELDLCQEKQQKKRAREFEKRKEESDTRGVGWRNNTYRLVLIFLSS